MRPVTVELPDETFAAARRSPAEVAREMKLALAAHWYRQGLISQGMGARIAGLHRAEFLKALGAFGVSPFQETIEDVREALRDA